MSVMRGEAISARALASSSRITSMRRGRDAEDVQQIADLRRRPRSCPGWIFSRSSPVRRCRRNSRMPRACSSVRRTVPSALITLPGSSISASSGADIGGRPVARHQRGARGRGVGAGADQADHLVDVGDRDGEPDQQMRAFCAPCSDRSARAAGSPPRGTRMKHCSASFRPSLARPAAIQRQHVDAEADLQLGEAVELVQHHLGASRRASARSRCACRSGRSRRASRRCPRSAWRAPVRRCAPAASVLFTW